jgi:hypothetical protein
MNPWEAIFDPHVIAGRDNSRFIEAANSDVDLSGIRFRQKGEWRATLRTERTHTPRPFHLARLPGSKTKATSTE